MDVSVFVANQSHLNHAVDIALMMQDAAQVRGTGIAKRKPEYLQLKMQEGKAVIALAKDKVVGFCYIESWSDHQYVANSGLIVHPDFRGTGLAKKIKSAIFNLSREKFPDAKIFGITTSLAVMKINSDLGYTPVTFSELTQDPAFWQGCSSCPNFDILNRTQHKMCLCTGMVCDPQKMKTKEANPTGFSRFQSFLLGKAERMKKIKNLLTQKKRTA